MRLTSTTQTDSGSVIRCARAASSTSDAYQVMSNWLGKQPGKQPERVFAWSHDDINANQEGLGVLLQAPLVAFLQQLHRWDSLTDVQALLTLVRDRVTQQMEKLARGAIVAERHWLQSDLVVVRPHVEHATTNAWRGFYESSKQRMPLSPTLVKHALLYTHL
jgi:hypothetical protein